jgi:hypothetical protein
MVAPRRASIRAIARPRPRAPPVISLFLKAIVVRNYAVAGGLAIEGT